MKSWLLALLSVGLGGSAAAVAGKPADWRRRYCETLLHALECPAGPVLTTRFGVGKRQIAARLRQVMRPGRMRRGLLAFCAGALAATLCCCAVRLEPASASQANTEDETPVWVDITRPEGGRLDLAVLTGQESGLPDPARPGNEMTDEEIFALAADLIERGQLWEDWAGDTARYALDYGDRIDWTHYEESNVNYRLLDVTDAAQLRAVMESLFSRDYVEERRQHLVSTKEEDMRSGTLLDRDGKLYANERWSFGHRNSYQYDPAKMQVMGATENSIALQVQLYHEDDSSMVTTYPLPLRREQGRWVLDGWKTDQRSDNSYIQLPEELAARAEADPALGTRLRYAWALGEGLRDGDQTRVDWAFSGILEPPAYFDWMGPDAYSLGDITGLRATDFAVETTEEGDIYLRLNVTDPGNTPLRQGDVWYKIESFGGGSDSAMGTVYRIFAESEAEAFRGVARGTEEDAAARELLETARLYRNVAYGRPFASGEDPLSESGVVVYLAMRMEQQTGEDWFTPEQFRQAALDYLDRPDYWPTAEALAGVCDQKGDRYSLRDMGWEGDAETACRWLGADLAAGTGYAVYRYYKDGLGLVPDYDLVYTLHRSQGGTGSWVVDSCQQMDGGWEGIS